MVSSGVDGIEENLQFLATPGTLKFPGLVLRSNHYTTHKNVLALTDRRELALLTYNLLGSESFLYIEIRPSRNAAATAGLISHKFFRLSLTLSLDLMKEKSLSVTSGDTHMSKISRNGVYMPL